MNSIIDQPHSAYAKEITRDFFKNVYAYMFGALAISGLIAYMAGTPEFVLEYFVKLDARGASVTPLFYVVAFAPLGVGLLIQMAYQRLSYGVLLLLFLVYAVLMGLGLSTIMLVYSGSQIAITFFVTAGAFGGMAILGYTTKVDLTKFGSLMYMAFIGIFIAGIANMFIESDGLSFWISVIGVFVFTGLTAYYMQRLKNAAVSAELSEMDRNKLAIVGGLQLYILFVNLFLSLLRIMGGRD